MENNNDIKDFLNRREEFLKQQANKLLLEQTLLIVELENTPSENVEKRKEIKSLIYLNANTQLSVLDRLERVIILKEEISRESSENLCKVPKI